MKAILKAVLRFFILICTASTGFLLTSTPVFATGGNFLMESAPVKGIIQFLNDASTALLFIAPILGGLLIALFSMIMGAQQEPHDKVKWGKNRKTVIVALIWVFSASAVITLITSYIK